jgi:hypothetical protein
MTIHTFGDSHSVNGWSTNIQTHHLGPILCYSFGKEKLNRCDIRNFNINEGDTIIFCFGEIDCRCHVHKNINETITYYNIIDNIIDNYFEAIFLNIITSGINLKNVCVYNIVPPVEFPIRVYDCSGIEPFPHLGSSQERKAYTLYFNKKLKEKCLDYKFIFFDIYDNYIDKNGFLKLSLSDGMVHIKDGRFLDNFIKVNNL